MEQCYALETSSTAVKPRDDASSSSIIHEPDFKVINPLTEQQPDPQSLGTVTDDYALGNWEPGLTDTRDLRLRRLKAWVKSIEEAYETRISRLETELAVSRSTNFTMEKWAIKHDA